MSSSGCHGSCLAMSGRARLTIPRVHCLSWSLLIFVIFVLTNCKLLSRHCGWRSRTKSHAPKHVLSTDGFCVNLCVVLARLCEPFLSPSSTMVCLADVEQ